MENRRFRLSHCGRWWFFIFRHADKTPDILIGDLDSIPDSDELENEYPKLKIVRLRNRIQLTFRKALHWVATNLEVSKLIVLGALGKRTDHLITNLLIASNVDESLNITFDHDDEWICRVTLSCPLTLKGRKGGNFKHPSHSISIRNINKRIEMGIGGEKH